MSNEATEHWPQLMNYWESNAPTERLQTISKRSGGSAFRGVFEAHSESIDITKQQR